MFKITPILSIAALSSLLSACYIVPLDQHPNGAYGNNGYSAPVAIVPMPAMRAPYTARLYPANATASQMGAVSGLISNPESGHGQFSFAVGGESFAGEATRAPGSTKGVANAGGNRGGYVRCDYSMSNTQLGVGSCTFSSGARYDMHISQ